MGRAQQMMLEHVARAVGEAPAPDPKAAAQLPWMNLFGDPAKLAEAQVGLWTEGLNIWQRALGMESAPSRIEEKADKDRRFAAKAWKDNPLFDMIRQSYLLVSERLLGGVDAIEGLDEKQREKPPLPDPQFRRRDEPVQLRAHQPGGARAGGRDQGREPAPRPRAHARRPFQGASSPIPTRRRSRSAATSRSLPARWSSGRRSTS
jgi:hypothetical protein